MIEHVHRIGQNKGKPRIWLDGPRLAAAGFTGGTAYSFAAVVPCQNHEGGMVLSVKPLSANYAKPRKVTGRPDGKPVIDITGAAVAATFPGCDRVLVRFAPGLITIHPAPREE